MTQENSEQVDTGQSGEVLKADDSLRVVWGWASVISEGGIPIVDRQGDVIEESVLQKSAHNFIRDSRKAKVMHKGKFVGEVVESLVLTTELQKALGVDTGRSGWLIGMHVPDEDTWQRVKKGELRAFSIGGKGVRVNV